MRILTVTFFYYYNDTRGIEPQFYYLFKIPESMGHHVDFFDYQTAARISIEHMRRLFLTLLRGGKYDAVFLATHQDEFDEETIAEARKHATVIAWNSDDEWRWDDYSSKRITWYDWMVTNSPDIFERERPAHPNLLHAQWACTGFWNGEQTVKDIPFSFAGMMYGSRKVQVLTLHQNVGLAAFGMGVQELKLSLNPTLPEDLSDPKFQTTISFETINSLWNRSRISFTPLDSSNGSTRQIKSRIFDMGLSRTLMLAHRAPHLNDYYEPGKEYIPFDTLEECADKARWYLHHEPERRAIAEAYARRTLAHHMWRDRITHILKSTGLQQNP